MILLQKINLKICLQKCWPSVDCGSALKTILLVADCPGAPAMCHQNTNSRSIASAWTSVSSLKFLKVHFDLLTFVSMTLLDNCQVNYRHPFGDVFRQKCRLQTIVCWNYLADSLFNTITVSCVGSGFELQTLLCSTVPILWCLDYHGDKRWW